MADRWAINASPLIVLSKIGHSHLLTELADELVVPHAVAMEISVGPPGDPAQQVIEAGTFPIVETPTPSAELLAWDLGAGETAVLTHVINHPGWTAIVDDAAARRCARAFSIPVKGTLAVLILARQRSLIPSAAELLRALRAHGFRISDDLVRSVLLQAVGETWD